MNIKKILLSLVNIVVLILVPSVICGFSLLVFAIISIILDSFVSSYVLDSLCLLMAIITGVFFSVKVFAILIRKFPGKKSNSQKSEANNIHADPVISNPGSSRKKFIYTDELFPNAVEIILDSGIVSAARLQSSLKIGSIRAVNLMTQLEEQGIIGPQNGNYNREIFISHDEWNESEKLLTFSKESVQVKSEPLKYFCKHCGCSISHDSRFCSRCGKPIQEKAVPAYTNTASSTLSPKPIPIRNGKSICPKCRGQNIAHNSVVESNPTGCFTCFIYILLALTLLGLLIVIPLMLRNKTRTVTYAVCQDCGHTWRSF